MCTYSHDWGVSVVLQNMTVPLSFVPKTATVSLPSYAIKWHVYKQTFSGGIAGTMSEMLHIAIGYHNDCSRMCKYMYQSINERQTPICVGKYLSPPGIDYYVIMQSYSCKGELPCNNVINALRNGPFWRKVNAFLNCILHWLWSYTDDSKLQPSSKNIVHSQHRGFWWSWDMKH